ncbi:putative transcriptional regulator [Pseudonocardia sp. Ae707_Ps1]|nr:putative transcriptional regulator [Pseudonocardia sp. Ae707_Ps1]
MSPPCPPTGPQPVPEWTAAAVARRFGIAPATLRSWSARYGIGPVDHQAGRYRRYSEADLAELEMVQRLRRDGIPMATAAAIARANRPGSAAEVPGSAPSYASRGRPGVSCEDGGDGATCAGEVAAVLSAARALDADSAVEVLRESVSRRGVVDTWNRLCRPALCHASIITRPAQDPHGASPGTESLAQSDPRAGPIDAECTLVWAITTSFRQVPQPPIGVGGVLLACARAELHTLALDALLAALHHRRRPARMLGPSVPAAALLHAAHRTRPVAAFVWAQTSDTADPATLRGLERCTTTIVAAGPGWEPAHLPDHVLTVDSIDQAVALVDRAATRI